MNTKPIKSSCIMRAAVTLLLTVLTATGTWAQTVTTVSTEKQLTDAIATDGTNIQLTGDIQLSKYLDINGKTLTIDLNGHKLSRNLGSHSSDGHVIWAHNGSDLTLTSTAEGSGIVEGGKANNGGAIHIPHGNTVTADNVIFQNNSAADHAGAIWNNGEFTATNCSFENNTAKDVGAIYNSVTSDGAGTATLTNCTFSGNKGSEGAGALANAVGATVMTIDGCTITGNTGYSRGGGIWNGGTLNMQGAVKMNGNKKSSGVASDVFLKNGTVITVTGSLDGSSIGMELESTSGTFTSGYPTYNTENPAAFFTANDSGNVNVWSDDNNEACLTSKSATYYDTSSTSNPQMKTAANVAPITKNTTSMGTKGKTTWYLASGTITNTNRIAVNGTVNLILEDGCSITVTKGIRVDRNNTLNVYAQSAGSGCGALIAQAEGHNASIGGNGGDDSWYTFADDAGIISIYGGSITAEGIGGGAGGNASHRGEPGGNGGYCQGVNIFGGNVKASEWIGGGPGGYGIPEDMEELIGLDNGYDGYPGGGEVSLSWTDRTDRIYAEKYYGTVTLKKQFSDNNDITYPAGKYPNGKGNSRNINYTHLEPYFVKYNITIEGSFDPACLKTSAKKAPADTEITLTAINGYKVSDVTAKDADNHDVTLTDNNDGTWTLTMPACAVTVTPTATRYYAVDFASDVILNVSESDKLIQGEKTYYKPGATIPFTVNAPNEIYELDKVAIYYNNEEHVLELSGDTYSFVMPEADVIISPIWQITACQINKQDNMEISTASENIFTDDGIDYYKSGAEITVKVNDIPEGRYLQNISILTDEGYMSDFTDNGDGTFTFTMPQAEVTLSVNFGVLPIDLTLLKGPNDFIVTKGTSSKESLYFLGKNDITNGCTRLFDDELSTKWFLENWEFKSNFDNCCYVEFQTSNPVIPKHYILTTGDDNWQHKGQIPSSWDVYAKVKSSDKWTCIAHVENDQMIEDKNFASYTFDFDNPDNNSYRYFRFNIYNVQGNSAMQLSEMQMLVRNTAKLADDADNRDEIDKWANETTNVTLVGRTLYMDDNWNTLCLPFDIDDFAGTPLEGFTVKELDTETPNDGHVTGFDNGTLYINFKDATGIKAGVPYIVKNGEVDASTIALTATNGSHGFSNLEGYASLVDGDTDTKWCTNTKNKSDGVWFCEFTAANPVNVTGYELTTGDDTDKFTDRNPKLWTLKGRQKISDPWTILDSRDVSANNEDVLPGENWAAKSYDIASEKQGEYQYFRFEVGQTDGNLLQLSELKLQGTCTDGTTTNPTFVDVTVKNHAPKPVTSNDGWLSFVGFYSPVSFDSDGDNTKLYIGNDNTLSYPNSSMTIGSCRACFQANTSLGDVNVDGEVNVTDVTMMVNHIMGMEDEDFIIKNADLTRDGNVTVTDVTYLVNLILGGNSIINVVINGADGLTFGGGGNGPAKARNN